MKTILCPTDFSSNAEHAAKYAAALADSFNKANLLLLHNYEIPVTYTEVAFTGLDVTEKAIRASAEKKIEKLKKKILEHYPRLKIETMLQQGIADRKIVAAADKNNAEFIVMGTTGTTRLERMIMGSTTSKVIRHANCPVLCIPAQTNYKGINKIIFATDMHEDNLESARHICPFAKHFNAEIIFVFVDAKYVIHTEAGILKMTKAIRNKIKYPKLSGYIVTNDSVTKGIDHFIQKHPADVLVMFTHEKYFPGTMFNQSMTKIMSHQSKIPLLSLKHSSKSLMAG